MATQHPTWTRHVGDVQDTIKVELSQALGSTLGSVSAVTATLRNRITGAEVTLSATVTDSANRIVTVTLGAWLQSTAVAGDEHLVSLAVTLTDGSVITFPEDLKDRPILAIV